MSKAKIMAVSQPIEGMTAEEFIVHCARVSNPENQNNRATASKLCRYLIKNKHWSPFEMVSVTMEIKTTRDIARQILRHRSFSFQEFSQRYASVTEFAEPREMRLQDMNNRQNSIEISDDHVAVSDQWEKDQNSIAKYVGAIYKAAIDDGIAKEVARSILPEGMTKSTLYMSGTLRSWVHYLEMRTANGTQKEHMEVAEDCLNAVHKHFPEVIDAVFGDQY